MIRNVQELQLRCINYPGGECHASPRETYRQMIALLATE